MPESFASKGSKLGCFRHDLNKRVSIHCRKIAGHREDIYLAARRAVNFYTRQARTARLCRLLPIFCQLLANLNPSPVLANCFPSIDNCLAKRTSNDFSVNCTRGKCGGRTTRVNKVQYRHQMLGGGGKRATDHS